MKARRPTVTRARFFGADSRASRLHDAVAAAIEEIGPARQRVTRSQIAISRRRAFAWTWRPQRYLGLRAALLVLSIALTRRDRSPRWKEVVSPRAGWFMHHLELAAATDLDAAVKRWLREAWAAAGPASG